MQPVIFTIPGINLPIPGYGLMLTIGFLTAILWAARRAEKSRANPDVILNCGFLALIFGVVGCRAMYVVHYWDQFAHRGSWLGVAWAIIDVTRGGLEFYGGFILASVAVLGYLILWKHSLRWYMDIIAPSAALGLAVGRLGCFLNGCCYGATCEQPWAVSFPFGSPALIEQWREAAPGTELRKELLAPAGIAGLMYPISRESLAASDAQLAEAEQAEQTLGAKLAELEKRAAADPALRPALQAEIVRATRAHDAAASAYGDMRVPMRRYGVSAAQLRAWAGPQRSAAVHPTQLYSTITAGLLALLLNALYWRRRRDGEVICTLFAIEPAARWMLEIIRADNPTDQYFGMTISQLLSLLLLTAGLTGLLVLRRLPPRSPRAVEWSPPPEDAPQGKKPATAARAGA